MTLTTRQPSPDEVLSEFRRLMRAVYEQEALNYRLESDSRRGEILRAKMDVFDLIAGALASAMKPVTISPPRARTEAEQKCSCVCTSPGEWSGCPACDYDWNFRERP